MQKILTLLVSLFFLNGCIANITVPIESIAPLNDKPTLIFYHEEGCYLGFCDVFIDGEMIGKLTPRLPLKINIEPGKHEIYVDPNFLRGMLIRRTTTQTFEKGKVYYMKIWEEAGVWVNSIRISLTNKIDNYTTKDYGDNSVEYSPPKK